MQSKLHRNNVYQSVELLLLVPMLFLLAIPKSLLIFKENYTSLYTFAYPKDHSYIRLILELTNTPFLNLKKMVQNIEHSMLCHTGQTAALH